MSFFIEQRLIYTHAPAKMKAATASRLRGLVFRLEPNRGQEAFMGRIGDCCRYVFNWALGYRQDVWLAARSAGATGVKGSLAYNQLAGYLGGLRGKHPFLGGAPYHCLQHALKDLDAAFERFFGGEAGYPNFRRKGRWTPSFRFPDPKQFEVNGQAIKLPKLGWVKLRRHGRPIPGTIKQITVKSVAGRWQCSVLVEEEYEVPAAPTGPAIGIDAGVAHSAAFAATDGRTGLVSLPVATAGGERTPRRPTAAPAWYPCLWPRRVRNAPCGAWPGRSPGAAAARAGICKPCSGGNATSATAFPGSWTPATS